MKTKLLTGLLASFLSLSSTLARDLVILPGQDPSEAIAAARTGDTVIFEEGKHYIPEGDVIAVTNKKGITILGENAQILHRGTEDLIMQLTNCEAITIRDLFMAHEPKVTNELCLGGVVRVDSSDNIVIDNVHLDGCGAWALTATDVNGLTVKRSKATSNSAGVFWFFDSTDVAVIQSLIAKNYESEKATDPLPILYADKTTGLTFSGNTVSDNRNRIFEVTASSTNVLFKDNEFANNVFDSNPAPAPPPTPPTERDPEGLLATVEKAYQDGQYLQTAKMAMTVLSMDPTCENSTTPEFYAISASAMLARAREVESGKNPEVSAGKPPSAADYYRYSAFFNRALATALLKQMDDKTDFEKQYFELLRDYAPLPPWVELPN
ncbi:MAG: right-handed parallel beta-helix repeat-containing protein [Verrucomicrobiota bacterium]